MAWDEVPDGALALDKDGAYSNRQYDGGRVVGIAGLSTSWESRAEMLACDPEGPWDWCDQPPIAQVVQIIALGLNGKETADDLRALAEAFEREHPTRDT